MMIYKIHFETSNRSLLLMDKNADIERICEEKLADFPNNDIDSKSSTFEHGKFLRRISFDCKNK